MAREEQGNLQASVRLLYVLCKLRSNLDEVDWRSSQWDFVVDNRDLVPLIGYTMLALFTRLYKIGRADTVVWDEVSSTSRISKRL